MNKYGLIEGELERITSVFLKYEDIEKAILYGSRAIGNFKPSSDIDLTLTGSKLSLSKLQEIETDLDDLLLPYKFDISIFSQIKNSDLLNHIERVGKVIYLKDV